MHQVCLINILADLMLLSATNECVTPFITVSNIQIHCAVKLKT